MPAAPARLWGHDRKQPERVFCVGSREPRWLVISFERIRETLAVAARVHPMNNPSVKEIAEFHLLHAKHEEEDGRAENAAMARLRAKRLLSTLPSRS